jgi:serine protease Do
MGSHPLSRSIVLLLLVFSLPTICFSQPAAPLSPSAIYERSHASVVVIVVLDKDLNPTGQGSGFIVQRDRVVTNHHVIEGAAAALVVFADGTSQEAEGISADSAARDLAILVVKTGARAPLKLGDELSVKQGDSVYALGAPRGLELSITNGIVSGFRDVDDQFLLQTTAAIAPGSSGGPLFDASGRVIGVTTALLSDSPGIYFSIGARDVSRMIRTPGLIVSFRPKVSPKMESASPTTTPRDTPRESEKKSKPSNSSSELAINSRPVGADIFIDGIKQSGQTPAILLLDPGEYNIVLRLAGYEPFVGHVEVKNIKTFFDTDLKQKQQTAAAWAQVNSSPSGAEIFVDGIPTGQVTPARVQIPAGTHIIALRLNGYQVAKRGVQATEGGTVNVTETLHRQD